MPPLQVVGYSVTFKGEHVGNLYEREDRAHDEKRERDMAFGPADREVLPLVTEADARAYAAEQTRELVQALQAYVDEDDLGARLSTPRYKAARDLIAKHKGAA